MKYIFGPVVSRRLGVSLGLDLVPYKTCTFDCIYCECGKTTEKTIKRKPYIKTEDILEELNNYLKNASRLDYITITGSGEPTLNSEIGLLINEIKKITKIPIAVLTNSSLLYSEDVRKDLLNADLIIPSLDAVSQTTFLKINRPYIELNINQITDSLILFRKEFKGLIWLEIFFVKDINDRENETGELIRIIKKIKPDKIQLNTIDRPPAENSAKSLSSEEIENIFNKFVDNNLSAEIIKSVSDRNKIQISNNQDLKEQIINLIKRRPETAKHIANTFSTPISYINKVLKDLEEQDRIILVFQDDSKEAYYKIK